jgi:DNA-binding transcriptional LysR family regulator
MDMVAGMTLFARVVDSGSFTGAAGQLGLSPSAVSKQVSRLEERLGVRLLNRTTRRLGLTEVGALYYERCTRILEEIAEAERAVSDTQAMPRGLVRLSVPVSFGQSQVAPLLPGFLTRYPEVRISVTAQDREVDLIEEGFDLAVRIAPLRDTSMIARRLTSNRRVVCATAEYFARHPPPLTPEELIHHNCLINPAYSPQRSWSFKRLERQFAVQVHGNLEFTSPPALREAALRGLGIVLLPAYVVREDLRAGRLQEVLSDSISEDPDVYLVYPHARHLSSKVRVFADFLLERFALPSPG